MAAADDLTDEELAVRLQQEEYSRFSSEEDDPIVVVASAAAATTSTSQLMMGQQGTRRGRVDDDDLHLLTEDEATKLCGSDFNRYETIVGGNLLYNPASSLRTIDNYRFGSLLPSSSGLVEEGEAVVVDSSYPTMTVNLTNFQVLYRGGDGCQRRRHHHRSLLASVDGVLTDSEIDAILTNDDVMQNPQRFHYNRPDRVIVVDEAFAEVLWHRLEPVLNQILEEEEEGDGTIQPLGFGVSGAKWRLSKVNPAMRINSYRSSSSPPPSSSFDIHRDAQFAESRKSRSVYSVVIYLNSVEGGGETRFTIGRKPNRNDDGEAENRRVSSLPPRPMTVSEELEYYHHYYGVETVTVQPVRGRCLIFTHDLLHESLPLMLNDDDSHYVGDDNNKGAIKKVILRTDLVATADRMPYFMTKQEVDDYREALALFNQAEQLELLAAKCRTSKEPFGYFGSGYCDRTWGEGSVRDRRLRDVDYGDVRFASKQCDDYYARSLYLRYRYPQALDAQTVSTSIKSADEAFELIGDIAAKVMEYLSGTEAHHLSIVCPCVKKYLPSLEEIANGEATRWFYRNDKMADAVVKDLDECHIVEERRPREVDDCQLSFRLKTPLDFHKYYEGWCRVAAVLVLYKLTHCCRLESSSTESQHNWYCARFIPQTGEVVAVPLERLIYDAFHNQKSFGTVFAVRQEGSTEDVETDFSASVDRSVMLRDYGIEFVGQNIFEHVSVDVNRRDPEVEGFSYINIADPIVCALNSSPLGNSCLPNVPLHQKGTCQHVFASFAYEGGLEIDEHCNIDQIDISLEQGRMAEEEDILFNSCIFDFERFDFKVSRLDTQTTGKIEYEISISDLAKSIEPFYHAAADHSWIEGVSVKANIYGGCKAKAPFERSARGREWVASSPPTIRIMPEKTMDPSNDEWQVTAAWSLLDFPTTL